VTTNHLFKKKKIGKNVSLIVLEQGLIFKAGGTALEGQTYEFMTGYNTIVSIGDEMKEYLP
jgi:hypothetical protein